MQKSAQNGIIVSKLDLLKWGQFHKMYNPTNFTNLIALNKTSLAGFEFIQAW